MNHFDKTNAYICAFLSPLSSNAMKKTITSIFTISFLLLFTLDLSAQCVVDADGTRRSILGEPCVNTLITSVPFLRIVPDARAAGMGDVGIGVSADANALHFNASKLAFAEDNGGIAVTYTPWLRALNVNDVYLAYISGFFKIGDEDLQAIGYGLRYFSLGDISFTDENGMPLGNGRPNEFEITASYSRKLSDRFSAGLSGKFIYSNLAAGQEVGGQTISAGIAGAADISMTYKSDEIELNNGSSYLTIGAALTNLGSKITYTNSINKDYIPANLGIGAAWDLDFDEYNRLTIALDVNKLLVPTPLPLPFTDIDGDGVPDGDLDKNGIPDYKEKAIFSSVFGSFGDAPDGFSEELRELMYSIGIEYWYDKQFAVRAGYFHEHATKGNRKYFTVGLGLKYNVFGLNISYLVPTTNQRNPLDNTLRFSLLFDFSAFESEEL